MSIDWTKRLLHLSGQTIKHAYVGQDENGYDFFQLTTDTDEVITVKEDGQAGWMRLFTDGSDPKGQRISNLRPGPEPSPNERLLKLGKKMRVVPLYPSPGNEPRNGDE